MLQNDQILMSGRQWFNITIGRQIKSNKYAFTVQVQADPLLEEFVKSLGNGRDQPLTGWNPNSVWYSLDDSVLSVYDAARVKGGYYNGITAFPYSFDNVGMELHVGENGHPNLSILRLVGISKPGGIIFAISTPMSRPYAKQLVHMIVSDIRSLVLDYIAPFNVDLRLVGQQ